jgi:hypothetical protein
MYLSSDASCGNTLSDEIFPRHCGVYCIEMRFRMQKRLRTTIRIASPERAGNRWGFLKAGNAMTTVLWQPPGTSLPGRILS